MVEHRDPNDRHEEQATPVCSGPYGRAQAA